MHKGSINNNIISSNSSSNSNSNNISSTLCQLISQRFNQDSAIKLILLAHLLFLEENQIAQSRYSTHKRTSKTTFTLKSLQKIHTLTMKTDLTTLHHRQNRFLLSKVNLTFFILIFHLGFGLLFDDKENPVVDEEGSSSEEGDYSEDEDNKVVGPDIQSIFSQLSLSEMNPPKSTTMVNKPYFMGDLQNQKQSYENC